MRSVIEFIDMDRQELNQLVEHASASLSAEEHRKLMGVVEVLASHLTSRRPRSHEIPGEPW